MTKWLTEEQQDVWRLWIEVARRQIRELEDDLQADADLTMSDYEVLVTLSEAAGRESRMSELAERAVISRSRLTYRVDRLVEKGFVVRCGAGTDGRGVMAQLTDAGMAHLVAAAPAHVAKVRELIFDNLDADDLDALRCILTKLVGPARA